MVDLETAPVKVKKSKKRSIENSENEAPKTKVSKKSKPALKEQSKFSKDNKGGKKEFNKKSNLDQKIKDKKAGFKKGPKDKEEKKPFEKLDKQQTREKQKKDRADRKTKKLNQDVFVLGTQAKKIWEDVRKEDCPEEKKVKLAKDLHKLVKGNIKKIIFAHDTVRVVECLMALGTQEIKDALFDELKEDINEMSKSKYASFFVQKLLRYGTKEQKSAVMKAMEGKVAKMMKHKIAGVIVELAYNDYANAEQQNVMLQEFLGPEYRMFKEPELKTVEEIIKKNPEKKDELIKNLWANVDTLITKGCYNHSLVHTVIHNYLANETDKKRRAGVIESLREALPHMIHSRDGAMAALHCIWHGTTKDRKSIVKSLKTFVVKTACEQYGHLVLLAIFDAVDDTKLVGKAIIGELLELPDTVITDKYGVRVIKYLMAGRDKTYTYPEILTRLGMGDGNENTKKDANTKRKELIEAAAPPIMEWLRAQMVTNLFDPPTTITLTAILNNLPASEKLDQIWSLLAEEASKPFISGESDSPNIVENTASQMLLKKIILKDKERHAAGVKTFSEILLNTVDQDGLEAWLTCNRGAFLMVFCWETEIGSVQELVREKVKSLEKTLKKQKHKGGTILSEKLKK